MFISVCECVYVLVFGQGKRVLYGPCNNFSKWAAGGREVEH